MPALSQARPGGKAADRVTTAIARELAGFVWAIAKHGAAGRRALR